MKLYLDTCCLNRPFDDRGNVQVYLERQAVLLIFEMAWQYPLDVRIVTSEFLDIEVNNIKDDARRDAIRGLMSIFQSEYVVTDDLIIRRSQEITGLSNIRLLDSLHLACAENNADVFITVDKRLIKMAKRLTLNCAVMSPITFLQEVLGYGNED